jgi:hypothetical protein
MKLQKIYLHQLLERSDGFWVQCLENNVDAFYELEIFFFIVICWRWEGGAGILAGNFQILGIFGGFEFEGNSSIVGQPKTISKNPKIPQSPIKNLLNFHIPFFPSKLCL